MPSGSSAQTLFAWALRHDTGGVSRELKVPPDYPATAPNYATRRSDLQGRLGGDKMVKRAACERRGAPIAGRRLGDYNPIHPIWCCIQWLAAWPNSRLVISRKG